MLLKIRSSFLNKIILIFLFSVIFFACEKKEPEKPITGVVNDSTGALDENQILQKVKNDVKGKFKYFEKGNFNSDSTQVEYIAGTEFSSDSAFGIKFSYFALADSSVQKKYDTKILNGTFDVGKTKKIKIKGLNYNLLYYNSGGYFLGSGGGEIFAYVIDFEKQKTYFAHFITVPNMPLSLYISPEADSQKEIKNFLISEFRNEYPEVKLVNQDHKLEDVF